LLPRISFQDDLEQPGWQVATARLGDTKVCVMRQRGSLDTSIFIFAPDHDSEDERVNYMNKVVVNQAGQIVEARPVQRTVGKIGSSPRPKGSEVMHEPRNGPLILDKSEVAIGRFTFNMALYEDDDMVQVIGPACSVSLRFAEGGTEAIEAIVKSGYLESWNEIMAKADLSRTGPNMVV